MKTLVLCIFFLILGLIALASVQAVGLSVSPQELKANVDVGKTNTQTLKVENPSREVSLFEVYPDDWETMIKPSPSSFILESGESREVKIKISPKEEGVFKTDISVVAGPVSNSSLNAGGGIKIPLEIKATKGNSRLLASFSELALTYGRIWGIILLLIVAAISYFVIGYVTKRSKK